MRFRAEQHLRRQRDIKAVRELGRRYECGGFTLWYRRRPPEMAAPPAPEVPVPPDLCRVCVIASTAAVGNAVARARAKRRLREVFRCHQSQLPPGFDLLLIARRSLNGLEYREIEKKFLEVCPRLQPRPA
ncbi:MAG TPA: ribonuclease P protein component [Opitutaceae bacterium]|nr:ribonuclease P protein component [Opitutaceae bacterium]